MGMAGLRRPGAKGVKRRAMGSGSGYMKGARRFSEPFNGGGVCLCDAPRLYGRYGCEASFPEHHSRKRALPGAMGENP